MTKSSLLLTRPQASAERFLGHLDPDLLGDAIICISPLVRIVPLDPAPDPGGYEAVVFSSAHAVDFAGSGRGTPAYCVGQQTARAASGRHWDVKLLAETADDLVASMERHRVQGPLVHLAGKHRRGEIAQRLTALGAQTDVVTLYDQELLCLTNEAQNMLVGEAPVIVPLFSPRTAAQFAKEARDTSHVIAVAISPAVAQALDGTPLAGLRVAAAPTGEQMRQAVEILLCRDSLA